MDEELKFLTKVNSTGAQWGCWLYSDAELFQEYTDQSYFVCECFQCDGSFDEEQIWIYVREELKMCNQMTKKKSFIRCDRLVWLILI